MLGLEGGSVAAQHRQGTTQHRGVELTGDSKSIVGPRRQPRSGPRPWRDRTLPRLATHWWTVGGRRGSLGRKILVAGTMEKRCEKSRLDERKPQTAAGATACWMLRGSPGL